MPEKIKLTAILIILALCLSIPTPGIADGTDGQITEPGNLLPVFIIAAYWVKLVAITRSGGG